MIKQARRYAARTSTRHKRTQRNERVKPIQSLKKQERQRKIGVRAQAFRETPIFLPVALNCAFSICRVLLPQNYRFCNSREFTACACLDINERKNGVLLYTPDTTANVPPLIVARVLVLITSRAENIFPINTALLPQALRKISRLYFNSLHKVIADLLPN